MKTIAWSVLAFLFIFCLPLLVRIDAATPATATVSWTAPTTYTDGSPIGATDLTQYTVSWSRTIGGTPIGTQAVKVPATSAVVPVSCGGYYFTVTATAQLTGDAPATSLPTTALLFNSGVTCTPNPPGGPAVQ